MSHAPEHMSPALTDVTRQGDRNGNVIRMVVLGVVLLLVVIGAVAEFGFTLPGYQKKLDELDTVAKSNSSDPVTRAEVSEMMGAEPAESKYKQVNLSDEENPVVRHQREDLYSWGRIIPGKEALKVYVIYECVVEGEDSKSFDPKSCEDAKWVFRAHYQPGNKPVDVTVKSSKKITAGDKAFSNLDDDGDGVLVESEWPAKSSLITNAKLYDPNGDKKITKEEFMAAIKELTEKAGGELPEKELNALYGGDSPLSM